MKKGEGREKGEGEREEREEGEAVALVRAAHLPPERQARLSAL